MRSLLGQFVSGQFFVGLIHNAASVINIIKRLPTETVDGESQIFNLYRQLAEIDIDDLIVTVSLTRQVIAGMYHGATGRFQFTKPDRVNFITGTVQQNATRVQIDRVIAAKNVAK